MLKSLQSIRKIATLSFMSCSFFLYSCQSSTNAEEVSETNTSDTVSVQVEKQEIEDRIKKPAEYYEAEEFVKNRLEAIFNGDCDDFYANQYDTIFIVGRDFPFPKENTKSNDCQNISPASNDPNKGVDDYYEVFKFQLLNFEEFQKKYRVTISNYNSGKHEYYFIGNELKKGKTFQDMQFINKRVPVLFSVDKIDGKWMMKGRIQ